MNARSLAKRLDKLEALYPPPRQRTFIRLISVAPGGEITGEQIIEVGGSRGPIPTPPPLPRSIFTDAGMPSASPF